MSDDRGYTRLPVGNAFTKINLYSSYALSFAKIYSPALIVSVTFKYAPKFSATIV